MWWQFYREILIFFVPQFYEVILLIYVLNFMEKIFKLIYQTNAKYECLCTISISIDG